MSAVRRYPLVVFFVLAYVFSWWPWSAPAKEGKGAHRGERLRALVPAALLPGPQSDRGSPLEDKASSGRSAPAPRSS